MSFHLFTKQASNPSTPAGNKVKTFIDSIFSFATIDANGKVNKIGYLPSTNGFRLTGVTLTPVMTVDSTTLNTLYLTPYKSGSIMLYDSKTDELKTEIICGEKQKIKLVKLGIGKGVAGLALMSGQALVAPLGSEDERFIPFEFPGIKPKRIFIQKIIRCRRINNARSCYQ